MNTNTKLRSKGRADGIQLMVHTGLTRTVAGCILSLERDGSDMKVMARRLPQYAGTPMTDEEWVAVNENAGRLASQARRFYVLQHKVMEWDGVVYLPQLPAGA